MGNNRLRLILGRAGTGKTARVMNEIRDRALSGEKGLVLLVPEQYSHDAERRLCAAVGDSLSLHGEVLSLYAAVQPRVLSETGGGAETVIDAGGRVLTMYRALTSVRNMLPCLRRGGTQNRVPG
jgi:ATP-dependent helicase/nuclease subunit B